MKFLASYIMRGRLEAMLTAATLAVLSLLMPPLSIVSSAIVALVTLRKGAYEGLIIMGCASLAAVIMSTVITLPYQFIILYVLVLWLPIWLIAIVLREGRHLSLALEIAILIGIAVVVGYYLYNANPAAMWKEVLPKMMTMKVPVENAEQMLDQIAPFMTGVAAAGGVLSMLLGLLLGRWWQAILYNPGGFKQEFLGLKAQSKIAIVTLVVIGIGMISSGKLSQIAWNSTILMALLYTFVGIAVGHTFFAKTKIAHLALPMFYITLILIPQSLLPVALVGFSDTWLDIRNRK